MDREKTPFLNWRHVGEIFFYSVRMTIKFLPAGSVMSEQKHIQVRENGSLTTPFQVCCCSFFFHFKDIEKCRFFE
jgi:hypothetical protein